MEPLYSGHNWGMRFCPLKCVCYRGVALSQGLICTKKSVLTSGVAFMRGSTVATIAGPKVSLLIVPLVC